MDLRDVIQILLLTAYCQLFKICHPATNSGVLVYGKMTTVKIFKKNFYESVSEFGKPIWIISIYQENLDILLYFQLTVKISVNSQHLAWLGTQYKEIN